MNRFDRIYKIHELLRKARHPVPMSKFMTVLESSRNSVTRDFEYMRNMLGAPLEYCREQNGHRYDPRSDSSSGERFTHPQRLIHYRSNWYLMAWCERANALRLFSIDRIQSPHALLVPCQQMPVEELDNFLSSGFGIFGGDNIRTFICGLVPMLPVGWRTKCGTTANLVNGCSLFHKLRILRC